MAYNPSGIALDQEHVVSDPTLRIYEYPFRIQGADAAGRNDLQVVLRGQIVPPALYRVQPDVGGQGGTVSFLATHPSLNPVVLNRGDAIRIFRNTSTERVGTLGTGYAPAAAVESALARILRIAQELTAGEQVRTRTTVTLTDIKPFARERDQPGSIAIQPTDLVQAVKDFARIGGPAIMLDDLDPGLLNRFAHHDDGITPADVAGLIKDFAKAGAGVTDTKIALGDTDFGDDVIDALDRSRCSYTPGTRTLVLESRDGTPVDGFPLVFPQWLTAVDVENLIEAHDHVSSAVALEAALRTETNLVVNQNVTFTAPNEAARIRDAQSAIVAVPPGAFDREIEIRIDSGAWHPFKASDIRAKQSVSLPDTLDDTDSVSFTEGDDTYRVGYHAGDFGFVVSRSAAGTHRVSIRDFPISLDPSLLQVKDPAKLGSIAKWGAADLTLPDASDSTKGVVELAVAADGEADTTRAVTPALLKERIDAIPAPTGRGLTENDQAKLDALSGTDVWQDNDDFEVATSDTLQTLANAAGLTYAANLVQGPRYADPAYIYIRRATASTSTDLPERTRASIIESQGLFAERLVTTWTALGASAGRHYWQVEVDDIPSGAMVRVESKIGLELNEDDIDVDQWKEVLDVPVVDTLAGGRPLAIMEGKLAGPITGAEAGSQDLTTATPHPAGGPDWTAWTDLVGVASTAVTAADAGVVTVEALIRGKITDDVTGGGDRVFVESRIVRRRGTTDTVLDTAMLYVRNGGNFGGDRIEDASQVAEEDLAVSDTAMAGDVYRVQVRTLSQEPGRTFRFLPDTAATSTTPLILGTRLVVVTGGSGGATGERASIEQVFSGTGTGLSPTNLTGPVQSAFGQIGTIDLDGNPVGILEIEATPSFVSSRVPTNLSFSDTEVTTSLRKTGWVSLNSIERKDAYSSTAQEGVLAISWTLYSGTTAVGDISLYLVKDSQNAVGYYTRYSGRTGHSIAGSFSFNLNPLVVEQIHQDTPEHMHRDGNLPITIPTPFVAGTGQSADYTLTEQEIDDNASITIGGNGAPTDANPFVIAWPSTRLGVPTTVFVSNAASVKIITTRRIIARGRAENNVNRVVRMKGQAGNLNTALVMAATVDRITSFVPTNLLDEYLYTRLANEAAHTALVTAGTVRDEHLYWWPE